MTLKLEHAVVLERIAERRLDPKKVVAQMRKIRERALAGGREERGWACRMEPGDTRFSGGNNYYRYLFTLNCVPKREKTQEQINQELNNIVQIIGTAGNTPGWKVITVNGKTIGDAEFAVTDEEGHKKVGYVSVAIPPKWHTFFSHIYDRESQIDIIYSYIAEAIQSDWQNRFHAALVGEPAGGKALPSETSHVLTPHGWKLVKDVKIGEEIVDPAGGTQTITGVFPQGVKPVYKITFSDRKSVLCCEDHLWFTETRQTRKNAQKSDRPLFRTGEVRSTKCIMDTLLHGGYTNHYIPMADCSGLDAKHELSVDPYLLGLLLGDGCFRQFLRFSTADDEILEAFRVLIPSDCEVLHDGRYDYHVSGKTKMGSSLVSAIRQLGLWDTDSFSKFIPTEYMFSNHACRLAILQGLMDTDGTVHSGCPQFSTSSEQLMHGVTFIVQSLGGTAKMIVKKPIYKGERLAGKDSYILHINLPLPLLPFRLRRKLEALSKTRIKFPSRSMTSIEYHADMDCTCISVSGKAGLFVTDECVVTHNTETARAFKKMLGDNAVLELDATATTQAGVVRELDSRDELPRIVIIEEIEKADFKQLPWLLGMLDPRAEIRKLNFRKRLLLEAKMLCIATINNYKLFKGVLEGALASRFGEPIFFPRPGRDVLRKILEREIAKFHGNPKWIDPVLDYAKEASITDPRSIIKICLAGKDELLKNTYQDKLRKTRIPADYGKVVVEV